MAKKHDINLDFVRAVAALFIVFSHFFDNTGLYEFDTAFPIKMASVGLRMIVGTCVAMFIMLTGYLCSEKKLSARYYLGFVRIYITYLVCSAFAYLARIFLMHESLGLHQMVSELISFESIEYAWYLLMYLGLFLMIPFLNLAFNGLETDKQRLVLIGTFLYLSILPSMLHRPVHLMTVWWKNLSPIAYYFTGAYLHKVRPKVSAKKAAGLLLVLVAAFVAVDVVLLGPSGEWTIDVTRHDHYQGYVTAVLCFVLLQNAGADRFPEKMQTAVRYFASLSLPIYLLSWITDSLIYPWFKAAVPDLNKQFWFMLPLGLLSFLGAAALAQVVEWLCKPIDKAVRGMLVKWIPALRE
ncbi:MAG: acyltransferase [Oscillospiraceae bacterium]|nr:acyltransferase [Oscillospiraceae bacterium]